MIENSTLTDHVRKIRQLEAKCHVADDHRMIWRAIITHVLKKNFELFNKRFMDFSSSLLKMVFCYEGKKRIIFWYTQQVILQICFIEQLKREYRCVLELNALLALNRKYLMAKRFPYSLWVCLYEYVKCDFSLSIFPLNLKWIFVLILPSPPKKSYRIQQHFWPMIFTK